MHCTRTRSHCTRMLSVLCSLYSLYCVHCTPCTVQAVELRQLKTELQIDKSQALKAQEERLRGEVRSGWVPLGTAVEQATRGCQTVGSSKSIPPETDAARLEASLKVRTHLGLIHSLPPSSPAFVCVCCPPPFL